ncbi:MAG: cytochrome c biogenesis protein ResB [Fermentimonas sp.]|nr:cytochrome c biogenesis protein ResB [Fermentimonas sp.]
MNNSSRKVWESPWGYPEGFIVATGVVLAGILLQLTSGKLNPDLYAYPVNIIIGALFVIGLLTIHFIYKKSRIVRWLSTVYSTLPAIALLLVLCIKLGLIPQLPVTADESQLPFDLFSYLGWYQMTTSWPFVLTCFYLLIILGFTTLRRTGRKQSWRDIGFYLNHLGLFIALLGGILGSADLERLTMTVSEGNVEWRGTTHRGDVVEMPLAIQLDSFIIEEYEPKLVLIDTQTGRILPDTRPESYMYEGIGKKTQLAGIYLEITDYLPHAAVFRDSIHSNIVPMQMEGAATALKVKATYESTAQPVEGWISNGSYIFPHSTLQVDENRSLAMPPQEVKRYSSHVTLYTDEGNTEKAVIEVNKPLSVNNWMIYQYSYDDSKGKYSDTSVFELVYDPWLKFIYIGIAMLLAGAIYLFVAGPKTDNLIEEKIVEERQSQS